MTDLGLYVVWPDNHACNIPDCACGVMERVEEDRRLEAALGHRLPPRRPEQPGPLSQLQQRLWDRNWNHAGNLLSDLRYWLWRLCR